MNVQPYARICNILYNNNNICVWYAYVQIMTVSIKQNTSAIPSQNADENALWTKSLPLYTVVMSLWSTFVRKTPLYNTAGQRGRVLFSATVTMVKGLGNISTSRSLLPTLGPILTATPEGAWQLSEQTTTPRVHSHNLQLKNIPAEWRAGRKALPSSPCLNVKLTVS